MSSKTPALTAAVSHFAAHADALETIEKTHRATAAVENRLSEAANATKPDFSKISALHSERQHLAERLLNATNTAANLAATFEGPGATIYHAANRARDRAADACVECIHARLRDDFPDADVLGFVARRHPVLIAEDARNAFVPSPRDLPRFEDFAAAVPGILMQIEQSDHRAEIYAKATATRSLPKQTELDAETPAAAKPSVVAPRAEMTEAEESEREIALMSSETRRTRELYFKALNLAQRMDEPGLLSFCAKFPQVQKFFPRFAAPRTQ
jgi:hypothetical protein